MEEAHLAERPALTLERRFAAAPEKVWRAWTDPQALTRWFGPGGPQPVAAAELDVRVGGRFRIVFGGPQGTEHEVRGVYREVVPPRRLAFTWTWPRTTPERVSLVSIEFRAAGRGTEMIFTHAQHFSEAVRDGHRRGWSETFVKLDAYLEERES
ncbi:MAG TPA: SRPBCC domain-containing protein [Burkholderiales bacterium]|nr:SRPBCC domain-containing protein [Burkholderiales bacterium]